MAEINNRLFDAALAQMRDEATAIYLCSADPGLDWIIATSTLALASYQGITIGATEDAPGEGRRAALQPFTGGVWTMGGAAVAYAIVDTASERVLASGAVSPSVVGVEGQAITLASPLWITFPGAA